MKFGSILADNFEIPSAPPSLLSANAGFMEYVFVVQFDGPVNQASF